MANIIIATIAVPRRALCFLGAGLAGSPIFFALDPFGIGTNPCSTSPAPGGQRLGRLHAGFA